MRPARGAPVAQVSKPAVSPISKSAGGEGVGTRRFFRNAAAGRTASGFGNPRYSRLGSLRYKASARMRPAISAERRSPIRRGPARPAGDVHAASPFAHRGGCGHGVAFGRGSGVNAAPRTPRRRPGRTDDPALRLPRPMRHEWGEGWGEGCPTKANPVTTAERLLSPTLSSVPNRGEGAGRARHFRCVCRPLRRVPQLTPRGSLLASPRACQQREPPVIVGGFFVKARRPTAPSNL